MTSRILNGTMIRTHEITNAGRPILDVKGLGHSPTWESGRHIKPATISISFYSARHRDRRKQQD